MYRVLSSLSETKAGGRENRCRKAARISRINPNTSNLPDARRQVKYALWRTRNRLTSTWGLPIISKRSRVGVPGRAESVRFAPGTHRALRNSVVHPPEKALIKQILTYGVLFSALVAGCSEDIIGPGDIARPLVGSYDLESRTVNTTIPTDTGSVEERFRLVPPQVIGLLRLNADGRYGQVDTTVVADSTTVLVRHGRWSVLDDVFFFVTDDDRQSQDHFTFDGLRLVRTSENIHHSSGRFFNVTDVWLKQPADRSSADE